MTHIEKLEKLMQAYDEKDIRLSAWEQEFLESLEGEEKLTEKQEAKLNEIYSDKLG